MDFHEKIELLFEKSVDKIGVLWYNMCKRDAKDASRKQLSRSGYDLVHAGNIGLAPDAPVGTMSLPRGR